jgi:WhiB family redox-sensing transcriptional regulator
MRTAVTEAHPKGQATVARGEDWRIAAACRGEDPELFFPLGTGSSHEKQIETAKNVCRRGPVISECLEWSLKTLQLYGISGGKDEEERLELLRKPVCPGCNRERLEKDRKFCSRHCSDAYRRQQAREKWRSKYPGSRIA